MCLCQTSKDGSTQPVVVIDCARFAWPRPAEATKEPTGVQAALFLAPKSSHCRGLLKVHSVPEFQECAFEHYQKGTGSCLGWGLIGAQQTCVQNTAQDYFYQESERRVS